MTIRLAQSSAQVTDADHRRIQRWLEELGREDPWAAVARDVYGKLFLSPKPEGPPPTNTVGTAVRALSYAARLLDREKQFNPAALCWAAAAGLSARPDQFDALVATLLHAGHHEDAVEVLKEQLSRTPDGPERRALYAKLASVLEEKLGHYVEAGDMYQRATLGASVAEELRVRESQARCLEAARRYEELLQVLERQLEIETSGSSLALVHTRLATLKETVLKDDLGALYHYRLAVEHAPTFEPPIQGMLALAEKLESWPTVVEVHKMRLRVETRPKERAMILSRLGEVLSRKLDEKTEAIEHLERAVREYPRGLAARLLLLEILCQLEDYARAERFATPPDLAEAQGLSASELARLCEMRARIARERGRTLESLECLCLALEVSPAPEAVLDELLAVVRRTQPATGPSDVLGRMARDWERKGENALAAKALLAQGLLYQMRAQPELAERLLLRAAELMPADATYALALFELFLLSRRFSAAIRMLILARPLVPPAERDRFDLNLGRVFADHLGQPRAALAMLVGHNPELRVPFDNALLAAALALHVGVLPLAQACLERARAQVTPEQEHEYLGLYARYLQASGAAAEQHVEAVRAAALKGHELCLRDITRRLISARKKPELEKLAAELPDARRAAGLRCIGDALMETGHARDAAGFFERAWVASERTSVEALEGLATLSGERALKELTDLLRRDPFHLRGLALLSPLLSASGNTARALPLYNLSGALSGRRILPARFQLGQFWSETPEPDPFLSFVRILLKQVPQTFANREQEILADAQPQWLEGRVQHAFADICRRHGLATPQVYTHHSVGAAPVSLQMGNAILVSPLLFHPDMPESAQLFTLLRGLGLLAAEVGPLSYLATYQLDGLAEALRLAADPNDLTSTPLQLMTAALEVTEEEIAHALVEGSRVTSAQQANAINSRLWLDTGLLLRAMVTIQDLLGALSALSLSPPPSFGTAGTRKRWLLDCAALPEAKLLLRYCLETQLSMVDFEAPSAAGTAQQGLS